MRKEALNEENEYNANLSFGAYGLVETSTSLASKQWTFGAEAVDIRCRTSVRSVPKQWTFGVKCPLLRKRKTMYAIIKDEGMEGK